MTPGLAEVVAANLAAYPAVAVAVRGGVDSLTLAAVAGRFHGTVAMFHAVSPAVPPEATERVRSIAKAEGWTLREIDAGEFERDIYLANPVNRCYYCKQSLYTAIGAIAAATSAQVVSGTNVDDLGEYRPGLDAAREYSVRHPFCELGIGKSGVRALARSLGLDGVSKLPSAPCLSSRVETGIAITPLLLQHVDRAEQLVRAAVPTAEAVRCRVRATGIVVEIDDATLARLSDAARARVVADVANVFGESPNVSLAPYRVGSAFLVQQLTRNMPNAYA